MRRSLFVLLAPVLLLLGGITIMALGGSWGGWLAAAGFVLFSLAAFAKSMGFTLFAGDAPDDFDAS